MCTALIAINYDKQQPLLILHNRDEYFNRPSQSLAWWPEGILAGKDLQSNGAWFGVNQLGYFCLVTNYRDPKLGSDNARSRGLLVLDLLMNEFDVEDASAHLKRVSSHHNPFNVIYGNKQKIFCFSSQTNSTKMLGPGLYGLSNAYLDTPWLKLERGKNLLRSALAQKLDDDNLWRILADNCKPSEIELPNTGIPLAQEMILSSIFVNSPSYGTRVSSILKLGVDGTLQFAERSFSQNRQVVDEQVYQFKV